MLQSSFSRILHVFSSSLGIILVHHGCSSELLGPHPPTIHYTLPRFILKDPGLQLLGNPQKQGVVPGGIDKSKDHPRAHERRMTPSQDISFRYQWDSVSRSHKTNTFCILHTRPCDTHNAPTI